MERSTRCKQEVCNIVILDTLYTIFTYKEEKGKIKRFYNILMQFSCSSLLPLTTVYDELFHQRLQSLVLDIHRTHNIYIHICILSISIYRLDNIHQICTIYLRSSYPYHRLYQYHLRKRVD